MRIIIMVKCESEDCKTRASYNIPEETIPKFCARHRTTFMEDKRHSKCKEIGCNSEPGWGYSGTKTRIYCRKHKTDDMIDLKHKKITEKETDLLQKDKMNAKDEDGSIDVVDLCKPKINLFTRSLTVTPEKMKYDSNSEKESVWTKYIQKS